MENHLLKKKIHGCLLGSLLGDCLGSPFEFDESMNGTGVIQKYFDTLTLSDFEAPKKSYTDDTAMTKCIARSLVDNNGLNPKDLAVRLTNEYYSDPRRNYGSGVPRVFHKLQLRNFNDVFAPAKEQFNGTGSYGNGSAMRIAPIALFYYNDYKKMIEAAELSAQITHSHVLGINGGILQCIAIQQSLLLDPKEKLDITQFCKDLISKMTSVETGSNFPDKNQSFTKKLNEMKELLKNTTEVSDEKVIEQLGNNEVALYSVTTAIYCFLKSQADIKNINTDNPFQRTLQYAISLGGDTDTIASMAGAIAGSYYGVDIIDQNLIRHCEDSDVIISLSDKIHKVLEESDHGQSEK